MKSKRPSKKRIKPVNSTPSPTTIESYPFYVTLPFILHHKSENKICHFSDEFHMSKYIERCKLKEGDYKILKNE